MLAVGRLPLFEGGPPINCHAIRTRRIGSTRGGRTEQKPAARDLLAELLLRRSALWRRSAASRPRTRRRQSPQWPGGLTSNQLTPAVSNALSSHAVTADQVVHLLAGEAFDGLATNHPEIQSAVHAEMVSLIGTGAISANTAVVALAAAATWAPNLVPGVLSSAAAEIANLISQRLITSRPRWRTRPSPMQVLTAR
jgi:hypothetical protein